MSFSASVPLVSSSQHVPSNSKRHSTNFAPSIWQDTFLKYADSESLGVNETMKQEVHRYKEKVKMHLSANDNNIVQKLNLIDSIQRLCVSHHFEREMDELLAQVYNDFTNNNLVKEEHDLHFTASLFRLFRQKGFYISSDIFSKFKNKKGEFDEIIVHDVQGMYSLFEATQLRVHGEDILEEAHEFTYNKLKFITNQLDPSLAYQINQSLGLPLYKTISRTRARSYMSFYEKYPSHDKILLQFAKLDYNMLQKWHQKEVGSTTKWWKMSELATKVPYARERIVELYFWAFGMNSEPKYSTFRGVLNKVVQWTTLADDTYDAYGTVEELELLTLAFHRWDVSYIASLPECFKAVFNEIVEISDEIIELSAVTGESANLLLECFKQALSHYVQGYLVESKWYNDGYIPTYDEYKVTGIATVAPKLLTTVFIALGGFATKETLHWISNNFPVILHASGTVSRLTNDLASRKEEQEREKNVSAVGSCMKQYGFSQKEAYEFIKKDINNSWKVMNEEYFKLIEYIPRPVLECIINLARICEFLYANGEDKITDSTLFKDHIMELLLDPVVV